MDSTTSWSGQKAQKPVCVEGLPNNNGRMLVSAELRWFWKGNPPEGFESWFQSGPFPADDRSLAARDSQGHMNAHVPSVSRFCMPTEEGRRLATCLRAQTKT